MYEIILAGALALLALRCWYVSPLLASSPSRPMRHRLARTREFGAFLDGVRAANTSCKGEHEIAVKIIEDARLGGRET